jgi:hypothetical protein
MNATKSFLVAVLFLLAAFPAQAATWMLTAQADGSQYYVETESIRRIGNTVECWVKVNYEKEQSLRYGYSSYRSMITLFRYDCFNRTDKLLQSTCYSEIDGAGDTVYNFSNDNDKPSRIIPGSVGEAIMKFACQRSREK